MKRGLLFFSLLFMSVLLSAQNDDASQPGDIIINEVMANPVGLTELPATEYVEIYNASTEDISLKGWVFVYDGRETDLPDVTLPAGMYAVLFRSGREVLVDNDAIDIGIDRFPAALANTGRTIGLKNSHGVLIDEVEYPNATAAKSYERASNGTWHLSTDTKGGTPGAANSQTTAPEPPIQEPGQEPNSEFTVEPLEIIINEILPEPFPDGSEYIELYNRSDQQLSLYGLTIAVRRADGSLSTHYPLNAITKPLPPESYIVLTRQYDGVVSFYSTPSPESVHEVRLPILNNTGASLVLFRASDNIIIDEVSYSSKWHDISIKERKGVSLERINPDKASQNEANWTSATTEVGYGTPGYKNSQYNNSDADNSSKTFINPPEYIPGLDFYTLAYQTDKPGYRCRAEVYTINGKKVAEVSNNQLITQDGDIQWDGKGLNNSRLAPGVYVFYAELYHPEGNYNKFKKAFLVK